MIDLFLVQDKDIADLTSPDSNVCVMVELKKDQSLTSSKMVKPSY